MCIVYVRVMYLCVCIVFMCILYVCNLYVKCTCMFVSVAAVSQELFPASFLVSLTVEPPD